MRHPVSERDAPLFAALVELLARCDPIGLVSIGAPADEYTSEASTITPRLAEAHSAAEVQQIVYEEFAHWFGEDVGGPPRRYVYTADEIWKLISAGKTEG